MLYKQKLGWLIAVTFIIKIIASFFLELGNDEVYYYTYAIQPDFNHFDHPPLVGLLIKLFTLNGWLVNTVTLRLGAIFCSALATWQMFAIGSKLKNTKVGWYSALIFSMSIYTSFIAGFFILPDSIQIPFWLAAIQVMVHLVEKKNTSNLKLWLLLGLLIGLAVLSKVHALYLWAAFGLFIIIKKRSWLLNYKLYAAALVTILCCLPIYWWNVQNNFITYTFHSNRVGANHLQWDMLMQEIIGEWVYQNPVLIILLFISLIALIQRKFFMPSHIKWLICCLSVPMLLLFWGIALFNPTLPHWSGPAYVALYFIPAFYIEKFSNKLYPKFIQIGFILIAVVLTSFIALANYSPINFGSQQKSNYGEFCPTLDVSGWQNFGKTFANYAVNAEAENKIQKNAPIVINKWFPGGHIEFYVARQANKTVIGVGALQDIHKFAWLNKNRKPIQLGSDAYCIVPSNMPFNPIQAYGTFFTAVKEDKVFVQLRSGKPVRYFTVYILKHCIKVPPSPFTVR